MEMSKAVGPEVGLGRVFFFSLGNCGGLEFWPPSTCFVALQPRTLLLWASFSTLSGR